MNTTTTPLFTNSAKPKKADPDYSYPGDYGYDRPSPLLFNFATLLQRVVSQAGSYHFTHKFHDHECGIYKCEGGCRIQGQGDLVLTSTCCYWDHMWRSKDDPTIEAMAALITKIVLEWDPMRPVDSMLESAAAFISCTVEDLRTAVFNARSGGVFGGNALSDFFDWNPFSTAPIQEDYERWCWVHVHGGEEAEVVQRQQDRALGKTLLKRINERIREANKGKTTYYSTTALCCSPQRKGDELVFWINTGGSTQIDGWKTEAEIEAFIASDGVLVDKMRG